MVILTFGSSTTMGQWDEKGGWADRLRDFAYTKAVENNFKEYVDVYNLGVDGDNSERLVKRFENEIKARMYSEKGLIIFIAIGLNDSQFLLHEGHNWVIPKNFENNLNTLVEISRKYKVHVCFIGITPVDSRVDPIPWKKEAAYRMEYIREYNGIVKKVAAESGFGFVDILDTFQANGGNSFLTEGLHPNTHGHEIIFEEVKKYLTDNNLI